MATSLAQQRSPDSLIGFAVHHSAVSPGAPDMATLIKRGASYDKTHSFRDYNGDGKNDAKFTQGELGYQWLLYHVMIARDGSVLQVQNFRWVRFHASDNWRGSGSLNLHGIGILLDGNFDNEIPDPRQIAATAKFVYDFEIKYGKWGMQVLGHRETSGPNYPTACPGKNMGDSKSGAVKQIRDLANALHTTLPIPVDPNILVRVDELKIARQLLNKRLNTVTNPIRRAELIYIIEMIDLRIDALD